MPATLEVESTLTDRYQTTVPETVRRVLRLGKRDKIHYTIRPSGEVVLTRAEPSEGDDPVLGQFLGFLARDIASHPERLQALRMACNIPGQEAQALSEPRVIAFGGHGAGQHYLATGADCVVNRVALPEPKGTTHGFRHRGLVAVGKRGFDSKSLIINSMHTQIV